MIASLRLHAARLPGFARLPVFALLLASALALPARADVNVRVEARPASAPIEVYITVTDPSGDPLGGFDVNDFEVRIDGELITLAAGDLTLPPVQHPNRHVSVVFTMDYSPSVVEAAEDDMEQAVVDFMNAMNDGDFAAIVKFNSTNPNGASIVAPFTQIDHGANNAALEVAARSDYPGAGTNLLDALQLSLDHLETATLPLGPKAILLISDGGEFDSTNATLNDVLDQANDEGVPIFTIGVADISEPGFEDLLTTLAGDTGGEFFEAPTSQNIADAYATILLRLQNEYRLSIANGITDCAEHELEVTITGQATESVLFTRRTCDTEPDPFSFNAQTNLPRSEVVTSNEVTISGIEVPAHISVISGFYSIGCGTDDADFTNQPGTISSGDTVCLRQRTAQQASTEKVTTLTIGGVAGTFSTTTATDGGGGGNNGGGGGASGLFELLLGFAALMLLRRRYA